MEIIELPTVKDDTDSIYSIKEAIARGYKDILIVGAIGGRFDHSLVNAYALMLINDLGASVAICGTASGVTIKNAKNNLDNATINPKYQYAISNEVEGDKPVRVSVEEGVLLLIKDR